MKVVFARSENVSVNEPFFRGHFLVNPSSGCVDPGKRWHKLPVSFLRLKAQGANWSRGTVLLAGIDEARFASCRARDQMISEVTFEKRRGLTRFKGVALVDGKVVCEATMMCVLVAGSPDT